jgi:hypothetical protein
LIVIMIIILWQSGDPTQDQEQDHDHEQEKAVSALRPKARRGEFPLSALRSPVSRPLPFIV